MIGDWSPTIHQWQLLQENPGTGGFRRLPVSDVARFKPTIAAGAEKLPGDWRLQLSCYRNKAGLEGLFADWSVPLSDILRDG